MDPGDAHPGLFRLTGFRTASATGSLPASARERSNNQAPSVFISTESNPTPPATPRSPSPETHVSTPPPAPARCLSTTAYVGNVFTRHARIVFDPRVRRDRVLASDAPARTPPASSCPTLRSAHPDHHDPLLPIPLIQLVILRHRLDARRAPRRKEIDHHHLPLERPLSAPPPPPTDPASVPASAPPPIRRTPEIPRHPPEPRPRKRRHLLRRTVRRCGTTRQHQNGQHHQPHDTKCTRLQTSDDVPIIAPSRTRPV